MNPSPTTQVYVLESNSSLAFTPVLFYIFYVLILHTITLRLVRRVEHNLQVFFVFFPTPCYPGCYFYHKYPIYYPWMNFIVSLYSSSWNLGIFTLIMILIITSFQYLFLTLPGQELPFLAIVIFIFNSGIFMVSHIRVACCAIYVPSASNSMSSSAEYISSSTIFLACGGYIFKLNPLIFLYEVIKVIGGRW